MYGSCLKSTRFGISKYVLKDIIKNNNSKALWGNIPKKMKLFSKL